MQKSIALGKSVACLFVVLRKSFNWCGSLFKFDGVEAEQSSVGRSFVRSWWAVNGRQLEIVYSNREESTVKK